MKNMLTEMLLYEYFIFKSVLGRYLEDGKKLFYCLCDILYIPEEQREKLYLLAESSAVNDITSNADFLQYQRIAEYAQSQNITLQTDKQLEEIIVIKGAAISFVSELHLLSDIEISQNALYNNLVSLADSGLVAAARIMGILQCEGIFVSKNMRVGLSNIKKAADWNDLSSLLALIHYSESGREYNISRLYMLVIDTPYYSLYEQASKKYRFCAKEEIKETKLLNKAFRSCVLKREVYDHKYARVIYSKTIDISYKERAVFNPAKDYITSISDLPLKLMQTPMKKYSLTHLKGVALYRENEQSTIKFNLNCSRLTDIASYRPLCLCSDSRYLLNMYENALTERVEGFHIEAIDVAELTVYDLEPTSNNIFVRSVNEDKNNIYLLRFYGEVRQEVFDAVKGFLQGEKRAKFHLNSPNVDIDLSSVTPVCLCDKSNLQQLKRYCDVIEVADVNDAELPLAVEDILSKNKMRYGISEITIADDVLSLFKNQPIDVIEKCLFDAVMPYIQENDEISLTADNIMPYLKNNSTGVIGFGFGGRVK